MSKIKAIRYEQVEQKNELEREFFAKLSAKERRIVKESWLRLLDIMPSPENKAIKK